MQVQLSSVPADGMPDEIPVLPAAAAFIDAVSNAYNDPGAGRYMGRKHILIV